MVRTYMKMRKRKEIIKVKKLPLAIVLILFSVILLAGVKAYRGTSFSPASQYYRPSFQRFYTSQEIRTYWPIFGKEECKARQDFILSIRPGGCQPAVVRSDLLEEQNVPVFCRLDAIKINPLIDIKAIKSISFKGSYPKEVSGIGFHPARAAIRSYNTLLGSPLMNDVGYLVIVLKRMPEDKMPEWVGGNLTARIWYDMDEAFGVGKAEFFLPILSDKEWETNYEDYGFWRGKGFLRANWIEPDKASLSVYRDAYHKESTITLEKGKTSRDIYLGGFYCRAALQLILKDLVYPETRAKIVVEKDGEEDVLWLYEGSRFLDGKCRIKEIEPLSLGGGSVTIRCGSNEFMLRLGMANRVNLKIDNVEQEVEVGDIVPVKTDYTYLIYIGEVSQKIVREEEKRIFIVLVNSTNNIEEKQGLTRRINLALESIAQREKTKENFENKAEKSIKNIPGINEADVIFYGEKGEKFEEVEFIGPSGSVDKFYDIRKEDAKILDEYFNNAIHEYRKVVQLYPLEKEIQDVENMETYGEEALTNAVRLAEDLGKQKTKQELLREEISNYPNTKIAKTAEKELSKTLKYDEGEAIETTPVGYDYYTFHLKDIVKPTQEEISASISVKAEGVDEKGIYTIGDYIYSPKKQDRGSGQEEFIQLKSLDEKYATIKYSVDEKKDGKWVNTGAKLKKIKIKELTTLGRFSLYVSDVKLQRYANVVVKPRIIGPYTETNLSFKIGIEKRGIKLSPEKTNEMINNLNESIKKWEKISNNLKKVVRGWKGVCYATSAILMVKNLLDNFSGKSLARQKVMRGVDGKGGWINKCKDLVASGKEGYASLDDCLRKNGAEIEKDVNAAHETIKKINEVMKSTEKVTKETIFGEKIVDTEKSFYEFVKEFEKENGKDIIELKKDGETISFNVSDLIKDYKTGYKEGLYTFSDVREWKFYTDILKKDISPELKESYKEKLYDIYKEINKKRESYEFASSYNEDLKKTGLNLNVKGPYLEVGGRADFWDGSFLKKSDLQKIDQSKLGDEKLSIEEGDREYVQMIPYNGVLYMFVLKEASDGKLVPTHDTYKVNIKNGKLIFEDYFKKIEKGKCNNPYKEPKVKFFEVEPYKGMPGIVPFDVKNGWYVATRQVIKGFGLTPYTDAGLLRNFYLCNVGSNGREEFESGIGDDICSFISFETGAEPSHPCLSETEARNMADKARRAVMDAARQYAKGVRKVNIFGQEYDVGVPMGGAEGTQCQDFMSPQDCYLLFNTCDPVLCPPSRCNLGGAFPVKDVVQSGILGSIVLCFPNIREGIFVPVCLTGIQAGIDAYVSILKAHRDCLQESLETGRMTGICDEIYSVYLCEFFWRQFAPLMDVAIPKLVELASGKGTRGGGEYSTITHAWSTLDKSIKYFTTHYAQNSYKAFALRSTDEVGSEICKAFVSARYPSSKKFFDALLEPESPVQYHAWFSEIPFTEATVPATSHYKVYYHIWAGKDSGAQYSVYLKDPPGSSFYASMPRIIVDTGYISRGDYISETKDFTAPSGYKTLCVRVNLQEECGFGQVSTSFALDYLKEQYAKDQAKQEITSEKECMSGTPSLYSLVQPNIQEAGEEIIQPALYKKGIIRVCSTDNPGKQTDPDRWKNVGYCDNEKVRCWLDMESVKANIKNKELLNETLGYIKDIDEKKRKELIEKGEVLSIEDTNSKLDFVEEYAGNKKFENTLSDKIAKQNFGNAEILAEFIVNEFKSKSSGGKNVFEVLDEIEEKGFLNSQKAKAILLRGQIYDFIARKIKETFVKKPEQVSEKILNTSQTLNKEESSSEKKNKITYDKNQIFQYGRYYLQFRSKSYFSSLIYGKEWMYTTDNPNDKNVRWHPVSKIIGRKDLDFLKDKGFEEGVEEILKKEGAPYF